MLLGTTMNNTSTAIRPGLNPSRPISRPSDELPYQPPAFRHMVIACLDLSPPAASKPKERMSRFTPSGIATRMEMFSLDATCKQKTVVPCANDCVSCHVYPGS